MPGDGPSPPPAPDYTPIANASQASADRAFQLGEDQLQWAKDQFAQNKAVSDQVVNAALDTLNQNNTAAAADRARYQDVYQPLEDSLVSDAQSYASPARKQLEMGRAGANVAQNFDQQRDAAQRQLESFGVDPSSTRYAALDIGQRASRAAAVAGAENQESEVVDATDRALRSEAINVGRGYPGQIAQTYGTALQAGNQGVNTGLATTASGANTMGTAPQYMSIGNQALNTWGNTLTNGYNAALGAFNAKQNASSGWGTALGLVGALGPTAMMMAGGGAVPTEQDLQMNGGHIPPAMSPSGGRAVDDVPVNLNADEFVIPADVLRWKGEEFFQKTIANARKNKPVAPAQPQVRQAVPTGAPARMASGGDVGRYGIGDLIRDAYSFRDPMEAINQDTPPPIRAVGSLRDYKGSYNGPPPPRKPER